MPAKTKEEPTKEEEEEEEEEETPLEFVEGLPDGVRQNVLALQALQQDYQDVFMQYVTERTALEKKYAAMNAPLYERRAKIVKGEEEPTEEEISVGEEAAGNPSKVEEVDQATPAAGIPNFWRTAMLNNEDLEGSVQKWDKDVLGYLVDVRLTYYEDPHEGYEMDFEFAENPYFSNQVLNKKVKTKLDEDDGEDMLVNLIGTKIDWNEGKNVTVELKKKKQKSKKGGGTRVVTKEEPRDSFFNFFSPPESPEGKEDDEEAQEDWSERAQEDFDNCEKFRENLIPRAVHWFTGSAVPVLDIDMEGMLRARLEDDDDDDDEEGGGKGKPKFGGEGDKPECKQQ